MGDIVQVQLKCPIQINKPRSRVVVLMRHNFAK